ncbi:MAG: hypothetical protein HKN51_06670 [Saprospiraceae bacterium]|nr:hypothetical protein [Saprospiraceae bacterium]
MIIRQSYLLPLFILYYGLICIPTTSYTQNNCPFISPIDGAPCINCAPTNWDNILTADLVDGNSWAACAIFGGGTSPSGGTSALLYGTGNNSEAIVTLIGGLIPGNVYNIGFYWTEAYIQCGLLSYGGGDLNIIIDGETYAFSGADDWEIAQLCFTATDIIAEIELTIETNDPGVILVDSGICEELETCCDLEVDVNSDTEICPGDIFVFDGEYDYDQGAVTIEWICSPDDGLDYLDDRYILNPTFQVPSGEFDGETFHFTLVVNDVVCEREDDFYLTVTPSIIPEFEFTLCEVFEDFELPTSSIDPFTGEWEGNFEFENLGGTYQEYIFTLDENQDNCVESHVYEFYIEEAEPVTFDLPETYCGLDPVTYFFDFKSIEGVEGVWDIDEVSPDRLTPDFYTYTFVPDPLFHCAYDFVYDFEIRQPDSLTFNIPNIFCILQENYVLPTVSLEGIQGDWDVPVLDVSTIGTGFEATFTPEEIEDCYYEYTHTYDVTSNIVNTFDLPVSICSNEDEYIFPIYSNEGYEGTWSPNAVGFDTVFTDRIISTWTPLPGQSDCLIPSSESVALELAPQLFFNLNDTICVGSTSITLPKSDQLGLTNGEWSVPVIDPNVLPVGVYSNIFTPDSVFCYQAYEYLFEVVSPVEPIFNLVTGFCPSQDAIVLPNISEDGISGTWSEPIIDPSIPNITFIESVFTPNAGQAQCLLPYTETFTIDLLIDPVFDTDSIYCSSSLPITLPTISSNGVLGTWATPILTGEDILIQNIFTPDDLSCYNPINQNFHLIQIGLVEGVSSDPTDCGYSDGFIEMLSNGQNFEYSIDNGITWTDNPEFNGLASQDYNIDVRSVDLLSCTRQFTFALSDPDQINILMLTTEDVSNCVNDDGTMECTVDLLNAEFSIDDGLNWQSSNLFENLSPGNYTVYARNAFGNACQDTAQFEILDFLDTEIIDVIITDVTECTIDNGSIEIEATGNSLEYNLGINDIWSDENIFTDLPEGNYMVYCRSSLAHNCIDSFEIDINAPDFPILNDVLISNPLDCDASDGSILINASGINLEFSIDGGQTWQISSLFENLKDGDYDIVVRASGTTTCIIEDIAQLEDPEAPEIANVILTNPTQCFSDSGQLIIEANSIYNLEYSIDNGNIWSTDNEFDGLEEGIFDIVVRPIAHPNCAVSSVGELITEDQSIEIINEIVLPPFDCVSDDGSFEIEVDILNVEYSIDNGANWQSSNTFINLIEGEYTVLIRKINSPACTNETAFEIKNPPCPCGDLDVAVFINHIDCDDPNSGILEILDIEGQYTDEDITITWSNGVDGFLNDILPTGNYSFEIQYDKNCIWEESFFIEDFDPINFGLLSFDKTCKDEGQIEVVDFFGGSGVLNFSLNGNDFQSESVFYNVSPEEYSVFVMDQTGCFETEIITLNTNLDLDVALDGIDPIFINQSTFLNPLINQSTIDSFEWFPNTGILNPDQLVAEVAPRETTTYELTVYFGDCIEIRTIVVEVTDNRVIYVADIFNPNDFTNNTFLLQGPEDLEVTVHNFAIFDRWGNRIFNQENVPLNDKAFGWDGTYNGKFLNPGVFTYMISYTLRGEPFTDAGTITLVN